MNVKTNDANTEIPNISEIFLFPADENTKLVPVSNL